MDSHVFFQCLSHDPEIYFWHFKVGSDRALFHCFIPYNGNDCADTLFHGRKYKDFCRSLNPYIRSAITTRISHLMGQGRPIWLRSKIHEEVWVYGKPTFVRVNVNLQHVGSLLQEFRVKLTIPSTE